MVGSFSASLLRRIQRLGPALQGQGADLTSLQVPAVGAGPQDDVDLVDVLRGAGGDAARAAGAEDAFRAGAAAFSGSRSASMMSSKGPGITQVLRAGLSVSTMQVWSMAPACIPTKGTATLV